MRGDDAREKCSEITLVQVPCVREKADLTRYRDASKEVIRTMLKFGAVVERASVDEAFIDVTGLVEKRMASGDRGKVKAEDVPNTKVVGHEDVGKWLEGCTGDDLRLAHGAVVVEEIRKAILDETRSVF